LGIPESYSLLARLAPPLKLWRHAVAKLQQSKTGRQVGGIVKPDIIGPGFFL